MCSNKCTRKYPASTNTNASFPAPSAPLLKPPSSPFLLPPATQKQNHTPLFHDVLFPSHPPLSFLFSPRDAPRRQQIIPAPPSPANKSSLDVAMDRPRRLHRR